MKLLEKKHNPSNIEVSGIKYWLEKIFSSQESENHYTIVIPPPNVTGKLHMGHVLNTIQDILIEKLEWKEKMHVGFLVQIVRQLLLNKVTKMLEGKIRKVNLTRKSF